MSMDERRIINGAEALRAIQQRRVEMSMSAYAVAQRAEQSGAVSFSHGMELLGRGGKSPRLDTIAGLAASVGLEIIIRERRI